MRRMGPDAEAGDHDLLQCVLRLPLPNPEVASIMLQVLRVEPPVPGTSREVQLWADDSARSTVFARVCATQERALRAAVAALLEQTKLVLRTLDAFPVDAPSNV
ncbi:Transcription factor Pcc1 [Trypanosoma brucei equiperdum]|uniref:Transcription factor Pcc1 n=1 Tax=Trypanosoma brucei equiperdum TaxID=630700 RepID=A0A3L6LC57_9TRYP|nr:Transcription factor Pcc1 [Trypanosoma brucei equiperdum]